MRVTDRRKRPPNTSPRLGPRHDVPTLLGEDALEEGVAVCRLLPEEAALPLPQVHLAQIGVDHRLHPGAVDQRGRRLRGTAQIADVHAVEELVPQPRRHQFGLMAPDLGKRRITLALDELECLALDRVGRRPVAHEQELGRTRGTHVGTLAEAARRRHGRRV